MSLYLKIKQNPTLETFKTLQSVRTIARTTAQDAIQDELLRLKNRLTEMFEDELRKIIARYVSKEDLLMIKGDKGQDADENYIIEKVLQQIRVPEDGYTPKEDVDYPSFETVKSLIQKEISSIPQIELNPQDIVTQVLAIIKDRFPKIQTGKEIIDLINQLPITPDKQIDASHIKNLPSSFGKSRRLGGGGTAGNVETPVGTVNGENTSFTVQHKPVYITVDGLLKYENVHYTYSGGTITIIDKAPPTQNIRSHF